MNELSKLLMSKKIEFEQDGMCVRSIFETNSGKTISIQASERHCCRPKENRPKDGWDLFEIYVEGDDDTQNFVSEEYIMSIVEDLGGFKFGENGSLL